ncbi:hypothetical protein D9758_015712 [Tetrapyrgos nigripes]|uniref:AMP-dependent synthetase/ligase domain-containing protein n=1 Tax=Tetrapyrgos nigripes TaxID=182062 RepID=A0A8H5CBQ6_9AGAR|nr:hypothetical protein D9758_015712 [Tetrapyrgos nigripes]
MTSTSFSKTSTTKPGYFGKGSVEIAPSTADNEGPVRRLAITSDKLVSQPFEGIDTIYDVIQYAARTHGTRKALGWREVVDIHEEEKEVTKMVGGKEVKEKKTWKYFQLSEYKYWSFVEFKDAVGEVGRALVDIGVSRDDVFNIFSETSPNWQLMANACGQISTTIATAYDTLGEAGLQHSLNEPECVGLFTNAALLPTLYNVLRNVPTIKYVVYDGKPSSTLVTDIANVRESIQVFSIDELRERGKKLPADTDELKARIPKPETMACIMYTSGSTGPPKGVCITHSNLVASIGAVYTLLGHHLTQQDTYLAYLPLAHVLEYIVELIMIFVGMTSGYGRVKTLTDASVRQCKGDLAEFKPSIMVGVPAVWETIRKGILARVNHGSAVTKSVFNGAMTLKKNNVPVLANLADVVLKSVKAATGGKLRIVLSGGAALSHETQKFLDTALVMMLQGYGMTESCGMCAILPPECMRYGAVGLPVPSIEIKLLDVAEAGYSSKNDPPTCIDAPFRYISGLSWIVSDRVGFSWVLGWRFCGWDVILVAYLGSIPEYWSAAFWYGALGVVCGDVGDGGGGGGGGSSGGWLGLADILPALFNALACWNNISHGASKGSSWTLVACRLSSRKGMRNWKCWIAPVFSTTRRRRRRNGDNRMRGTCIRARVRTCGDALIGSCSPRQGVLRGWVKNLIKLQGGEYIALERLESTYKACNLVSNICVHATPDAKQPIAIIIPHEAHLRHALQSVSGVDATKELDDLCHDPKVAALVLKECNAVGKKNGFKSIEILQSVILTPDEWTPESGLVTAAQKIQRKKIAETFDKEIKEAYKDQ